MSIRRFNQPQPAQNVEALRVLGEQITAAYCVGEACGWAPADPQTRLRMRSWYSDTTACDAHLRALGYLT